MDHDYNLVTVLLCTKLMEDKHLDQNLQIVCEWEGVGGGGGGV